VRQKRSLDRRAKTPKASPDIPTTAKKSPRENGHPIASGIPVMSTPNPAPARNLSQSSKRCGAMFFITAMAALG
jgi:hypothetical protein